MALALLVATAACYYRKYDPLVRTHVELMVAMAEKRRDLALRRQAVANSAEFTYPLERARDFTRIVRGRFAERKSFQELERFLARYADFLAVAAAAGADAEALRGDLEALRASGRSVVAALDAEQSR